MRHTIAAWLVLVLAGPVDAGVHVDIGIRLPAPPPLVVVPAVPVVQYAPSAPANVFFYGGQYWVFTNGGWYASAGYDGPWVVVAPQIVPRPLLVVPIRYYHVPPGHLEGVAPAGAAPARRSAACPATPRSAPQDRRS